MPHKDAANKVYVIDAKQYKTRKRSSLFAKIDEEEIDPSKSQTTYFETLMHMVKACFGTGILAIPSAFSRAGWLIGVIGVVIIGTICTYAFHILVVDFYQDPKDRLAVQWYMVILLIPLILIGWVRNLKYLAPFSIIGTVATFTSFGIIFYYLFLHLPPLKSIEPIGDGPGFIVFFSTVLFSLESVGVIMPLKNQMKKPEQFGMKLGVLNAAMIPNLTLFLLIGFFGYLKYGVKIEESIPLSLPSNEIPARISRLLLVLAIFISHPLQLYMAFDIIWIEFLEPKVKYYKMLKEYAVRTTLVVLTVVFAASIPHLNLFIALIGSFCYSTLGLTFPAIISLFAHWDEGSGLRFFVWSLQHYLIMFVGLSALIVGSSTAMRDITHELMS